MDIAAISLSLSLSLSLAMAYDGGYYISRTSITVPAGRKDISIRRFFGFTRINNFLLEDNCSKQLRKLNEQLNGFGNYALGNYMVKDVHDPVARVILRDD